MNTFQLWYALSGNPVTADQFDGVYSADTIGDVPNARLIICNTDIASKPGSHWVVFYRNGDDLEFFDSLGKPIDVYHSRFKEFVQASGVKNVRTVVPYRIQPIDSSLCGEYCLYYAYARMKGEAAKEIIRHVPSAQTLNVFIGNIFTVYSQYNRCKHINVLCNQSCVQC